jgi:hypothetical protein
LAEIVRGRDASVGAQYFTRTFSLGLAPRVPRRIFMNSKKRLDETLVGVLAQGDFEAPHQGYCRAESQSGGFGDKPCVARFRDFV